MKGHLIPALIKWNFATVRISDLHRNALPPNRQHFNFASPLEIFEQIYDAFWVDSPIVEVNAPLPISPLILIEDHPLGPYSRTIQSAQQQIS